MNNNQEYYQQLITELTIAKAELARYMAIDSKKNARKEIVLIFLGKLVLYSLGIALLAFLYVFALWHIGIIVVNITCAICSVIFRLIFGSLCTIILLGLPLICIAPCLLPYLLVYIPDILSKMTCFFLVACKPFVFLGRSLVNSIGIFREDMRICRDVKKLICETQRWINILEEKIKEAKKTKENQSQQSNDSFGQENSSRNHKQNEKKEDGLSEYYVLLEVSPDCTDEELRKQYRRLMKEYHPDRLANMELGEHLRKDAEEKCKKINNAYEIICEHRKTAHGD